MSERRRSFLEDGYLVLRDVVDREHVARAIEEAESVRMDEARTHIKNLRARWQNHIETGESILDVIDPIVDLAPAIANIAQLPALVSTLEDILEDRVHLFKDKLIFKPPGALGHGWHQDYIAWPGFPKSFTTVLVALDAANEGNGCLEVFGGAQRAGNLSPADGDYHDLPAGRFDPATHRKLTLKPGDVAIFGCFLPHGSGPNRSSTPRRHLYLSYNRARDGGDGRAMHYRQFHAWLKRRYAEYGATDFYFK